MQNQTSPSYSDLYEKVAIDIETLENAIGCWPPNKCDYVLEYLLQKLLASMSRCKDGLSLLERQQRNKDQNGSLEKLQNQFLESKNLAEILLDNNLSEILLLFSQQNGLGLRLHFLAQQLENIKNIVENDFLHEKGGQDLDDLMFHSAEFLDTFTDFARIVLDAPRSIALNKQFIEWKADFQIIENSFKEEFSYFGLLKEYLESRAVDEYDQKEFWWLQTTPPASPEFKTYNTEDQFYRLSRMLIPRRDRETPGKDCPDSEMIIAYANRDQIGEEIEWLVESHVKQCDTCLDLLLDIRAANATVQHEQELKDALLRVPAWISDSGHGDGPPQKVAIKTEFPKHIPKTYIPKGFPNYVAIAQAIRPSASSLVRYQDTSAQEQPSFAKVITVQDEEIVSLEFLFVRLETFIFNGENLLITGQVEDLNPEYEEIQWLCDWLTKDGYIIEPLEFKTSDTGFIVSFRHPGKDQPKGELRILLLRTQSNEYAPNKT